MASTNEFGVRESPPSVRSEEANSEPEVPKANEQMSKGPLLLGPFCKREAKRTNWPKTYLSQLISASIVPSVL